MSNHLNPRVMNADSASNAHKNNAAYSDIQKMRASVGFTTDISYMVRNIVIYSTLSLIQISMCLIRLLLSHSTSGDPLIYDP